MYLFSDTETTGLPSKWKAAVTDMDNWPHLVQPACLYYDRSGNLVSQKNFIIRPEGFVIPPDSSRIHGITTERAQSEGVILLPVLEHFCQRLAVAECLVGLKLMPIILIYRYYFVLLRFTTLD